MSGTHRITNREPRGLPAIVERALSIAAADGDDVETQRLKRLIVGGLFVALLMPWPGVVQLALADAPLAAWATVGSFLTALIALVALRLGVATHSGVLHLVIAGNLSVSVVIHLSFGGFLASGANFLWLLVLLIAALAILGDRRATAWLFVSIALFLASMVATNFIEPPYVHPDPELGATITFLIILIFNFFVLRAFVQQRADLLQISDGLLTNILPAPIAARLKHSDDRIADEYESASILFADVADFTPMSAGMTPHELVALLDDVFSDFDALVESMGLEKIKTIGDAYMVAAGVPEARDDHAEALCELALAMRDRVGTRTYRGQQVRFRIGINSGPVVAGIIGIKKFSYDLWGDSVNTASRMESFGKAGRIQVTRATRDLAEGSFVFESGGVVDVKGKGPMEVWFLESRSGSGGV